MANPHDNAHAIKRKSIQVRLSETEFRRIRHEAVERGISVGELTRSLYRIVSGVLPFPAAQRSGGGGGES
jgi:predicted DNA binding CopG/RHH family protein